jgi:ankyrin repeat protein
MTALSPKERPTAAQLFEKISNKHSGTLSYHRSCCFEVQSDSTSWQGSESEVGPSGNTNAGSDSTTIAAQEENGLRIDPSIPDLLHHDNTIPQPVAGRTPRHHQEEASIFADDATWSSTAVELKSVFDRGHHALQDYLAAYRQLDPSWRSLMQLFVEKQFVNCKGYNIFLMASKFSNVALSGDVLAAILEVHPEMIHTATFFGNTALHFVARKGRTHLVRLLLDAGAALSPQNVRGITPLSLAARGSHQETSLDLIARSTAAELEYQDDGGCTVMLRNRNATILQSLLSAGATPLTPDIRGYTYLQYCQTFMGKESLTEIVRSWIRQHNPEFEPEDDISVEEFMSRGNGMSLESCVCEPCLIVKALQRSGVAHDPKLVTNCSCPHHMSVYAEDTTGYDYVRLTFWAESCHCVFCSDSRQYNMRHDPCGRPFDGTNTPYSESLQRLEEISSNGAAIPDAQSIPSLVKRPLVPYYGHTYYDGLIQEDLRKTELKLSEQSVTEDAVKYMADSGFRISESSSSKPNQALKWIIDHLKNIDATLVVRIVELLLSHGGDIDLEVGWWRYNTIMCRAIEQGNLSLIALLLKRGASVQREFKPVLYAAAKFRQPLAARMLLVAGAGIDHVNHWKRTTMFEAVEKSEELGWIIPLLLAHGASTEIRDQKGRAPLHIATANSQMDIVTALLEAGARVNAIDDEMKDSLNFAICARNEQIARLLLSYGANIHQCTAIWHAVSRGLDATVRLLIDEYGARCDVLPWKGYEGNILHAAAQSSMRDPEVVGLLFQKGIDVDQVDGPGYTALHYAAKHRNLVIAKQLVAHGANVHKRSNRGETPIQITKSMKASGPGRQEMIDLLGGSTKKSWWKRF